MATLREVIQDELRARGYRQSAEDPAYWSSPDDDWSDKLLAAVRDCFEREEENHGLRVPRPPDLLHGIGSLADLTGKQIRLMGKQIVQRDPCSFCGYYTRDPRPEKRKRIKTNLRSRKKGARNIATVDHIVPKTNHGEDNSDNYAGACRHCNGRKGDLSLLHYLLERQNN